MVIESILFLQRKKSILVLSCKKRTRILKDVQEFQQKLFVSAVRVIAPESMYRSMRAIQTGRRKIVTVKCEDIQ